MRVRVLHDRPIIPPPTSANSSFDYQTAADFLNGKTVTDEAVRKFVAASRGAHDGRTALRAQILALHGVLASREAEIALLKKTLMDAEAQQPASQPVLDSLAASAPAGRGVAAVPVKPTPEMIAAAWSSGTEGGGIQDVEEAWTAMLAVVPTPAAQPAVLDDTALLDWLALAGPTSICLVIDRQHDGEIEVSTDDVTGYGKTLREAIDDARKQGKP